MGEVSAQSHPDLAGEEPMPMNAADYRESLRRHSPRVFVDGARIDSVVDAPALQPGINALGLTYDFALRDELAPIMRAVQASSGKTVNRMLHVDQSSADLLNKLEAVRILCQQTGCAQRYLAHDAIGELRSRRRASTTTRSAIGERFTAYLAQVQDNDLALGIAMTDAKGDRSKRPHEQANVDTYVHVVERDSEGNRHHRDEGDRHRRALRARAPRHAEPQMRRGRGVRGLLRRAVRRAGITIISRPAGRPGEKAALFSNKYGQSTGVVVFDRVFVAWERVFLAGEWEHSAHLTYSYATASTATAASPRARARRSADRRRRADVRGERLRSTGQESQPARATGASDHEVEGSDARRRRRERLRDATDERSTTATPTR